jgi:hypothetical protein
LTVLVGTSERAAHGIDHDKPDVEASAILGRVNGALYFAVAMTRPGPPLAWREAHADAST